MNKGQVWAKDGDIWYAGDVSETVDELPMGVYILEIDQKGNWQLKRQSDEFTFDFKVYGLESDLIRRVTTYYQKTSGDVGVLLNGVKGTGKTITAKILANQLQNPIILVTGNSGALVSVLNDIKCDITIVIDEFEKSFGNENGKEGGASLLSIMDGTIQSEYRRVWLLTTNNLYINQNLLNRPGRIRYKKEFKDLDLKTIYEVLDDILEYPEFREDIVSFCKTLELITVDILKTIVTEVNIFAEAPQDCCSVINVNVNSDRYTFVNTKTGEVLKGTFNIADVQTRKQFISRGLVGQIGFQKFEARDSWDTYEFIRVLEDGTFLYNWRKADKNDDLGEPVEVVLDFVVEKHVHAAFAY